MFFSTILTSITLQDRVWHTLGEVDNVYGKCHKPNLTEIVNNILNYSQKNIWCTFCGHGVVVGLLSCLVITIYCYNFT